MDVMVIPMQERMEDWKRNAGQLDKDHAKGDAMFITRGQQSTYCHLALIISKQCPANSIRSYSYEYDCDLLMPNLNIHKA